MTYTPHETLFDVALELFVKGCSKISNDHRERHYPNNSPIYFETMHGKKYIRVVRADPHKSVHCFVEISSGDVLKAASWKAPAKHARGNIHDEHGGLGSMGEYGPAYLK